MQRSIKEYSKEYFVHWCLYRRATPPLSQLSCLSDLVHQLFRTYIRILWTFNLIFFSDQIYIICFLFKFCCESKCNKLITFSFSRFTHISINFWVIVQKKKTLAKIKSVTFYDFWLKNSQIIISIHWKTFELSYFIM